MHLLVVDDHPIIISAIRSLLSDRENIFISGAHSIAEARCALDRRRPDVVVLDLNLPDGSGFTLLREIANVDDCAVIIFSIADAPMIALQAIQYGAKAFLSKTDESGDIEEAIIAVSRGETWLPERLIQELALMKVYGKPSGNLLSEREQEIMRDLANGRNFSQIAKKIAVSYWTVVKECDALKNKFNARNASDLVRIAVELKLV